LVCCIRPTRTKNHPPSDTPTNYTPEHAYDQKTSAPSKPVLSHEIFTLKNTIKQMKNNEFFLISIVQFFFKKTKLFCYARFYIIIS
jgi:hypothetical protein